MRKIEFFGLFKKKEVEERADASVDDVLLSALIGTSETTRETALQIPALNGCIEYIGNTVSMLPIKLYKEVNGVVEEVKDDNRVRLLNDDTGDTLDSAQMWKALLQDYYLGKGGYVYINKERNQIKSIHYVEADKTSIIKNTDPIFKDYKIMVHGKPYNPFEFIKILRNTKDGMKGTSIFEECPLLIDVGYNTLVYEKNLVATGGNKKGFVKAAKRLTQEAIDALKTAWKNLYSNNTENIVVLNDGIEFQEANNTSVEMQLNENKKANATEICKVMNVPESIINGTATATDYVNGFKMAVMPILKQIESALNKDLLLEKEKKSFYFAFDTNAMTKGDIKTRYEAYKLAVEAGWMSKNEIRYEEDKPEIEGLDIVTMSLGEVIYDINSKTYFTPNTKSTTDIESNETVQLQDNIPNTKVVQSSDMSDSNENDNQEVSKERD